MLRQSPRPLDDAAEAEAAALAAWIGREERTSETVSALPSARLLALLDSSLPHPAAGEAIAPLSHWLHFLPVVPHAGLAADGHPRRGGFVPPVSLPRRMFAGARMSFPRLLRVGEPAERVATIAGLEAKQGRSGPLIFLRLHVEIVGEDGPAVVEDQDIVYRGPEVGTRDDRPAPPHRSGDAPDLERVLVPDERHLFLYSALLYSAHRIHFDRPYTVGIEGYAGLVVHGQLVASALAELAVRDGRRLAGFSYRSRRPLFVNEPIRLAARRAPDGLQLTAAGPDGAIAVSAEATLSAA